MIEAQLHSPRPHFRTATRVAIVGAGFSGTLLAIKGACFLLWLSATLAVLRIAI